MERTGEHRADVTENRIRQHLDRAGFAQNLRHAQRTAHEHKAQEIDLAKLISGQDAHARERRHEPDTHTDNRRIDMMDEIRRPDTYSHRDPECRLFLRGGPRAETRPLLAN